MKKSTKLLSVILAIVMLFSSMTVLASAAKTNYKTHDDLVALDAYSPYGTVTRLTTEERTSMIFDYLDTVLGEAGIVLDTSDIPVVGGDLYINLTSVTELCKTVDSVYELLTGALVGAAGFFVDLGVIEELNLDNWQTGMTRDNQNQLHIVEKLLLVLRDNASVVGGILRDGSINLGTLNGAVGSSLAPINEVLGDIPGLIKGLIFPLMERQDDDFGQMMTLAATADDGGVQDVLSSFVTGLFTKPQSITSYKEDASGKCISNHTLPTSADGLRYYYEKGTDDNNRDYYTVYVADPTTMAYTAEEARYYKTEEPTGSGEYVYKNAAGDNLKYYENDSYWLPSLAQALQSGTETLDLNSETPASLLYKFAPYVFDEMAPVVLNGSVKKALAEWFGAKFTYVGDVGSAEVEALPDSSDVFFTQEQGEYLWEWSDYKVINGNHYYRFEDQIFSSDLSNTNPYFDIINWDYKINPGFIDEFIPADGTGSTASAAGYTTVLAAANDFLGKVIRTVFTSDVVTAIGWTKGGNDQLLENAKKAARYVVSYSPESIFGEDYNNGYYQLMMSEDSNNQEIVCGIAAKLIELLMPQLNLPSAENLKGQNVGALFAAIIRELATQLLPTYNYDALIYADYNTKTFLSGKDNSYWLDVCLTMGVDIGMNYLRNLIDLGEDTDVGYKFAASKTYDLASFEANPQAWEGTIDWVVDWALSSDYDWTWKMDRFVDTTGLTVNLATTEDPWPKLDAIIRTLIPVEEIFNVTPAEGKTWLETALRDNLVLSLLNLDIETPVSMLNIPTFSVLRMSGLFSAVVQVVRNLINGVFYKVAGGNLIDPATITTIDSVFNQQNLATFVEGLLQKLYTAYSNGLLDAVMPFLNFFIGWTTDAQKFVAPDIEFELSSGYNYLYANGSSASASLNVRNDCAGMLLEHRNSSAVDQNYVLTITGVESTYGNVSATGLPAQIVPGGNATIPISVSYNGDRAIAIDIIYTVSFKDGTPIGGEQRMTVYQYISNQLPESETSVNTYADQKTTIDAWGDKDLIGVGLNATPKAYYITSLNEAAKIGFTFRNVGNEGYAVWVKSASASGYAPFVTYSDDFVQGDNENADKAGQGLGWMNGEAGTNQNTIYPYMYDVNADVSGYESGSVIDMGTFTVQWHNHRSKTWVGSISNDGGDNNATFTIDVGDLYYADTTDLQEALEGYSTLSRSNYASSADAEWTAMQNALCAAAERLYKPFTTANFASLYSVDAMQTLIDNMSEAYEALAAKPSETSDFATVETALKNAEGENGVNFQNYEFFEYWDYEDAKRNAESILAAYQTPEEPDSYIEGSDLSEAEITAIADSAANATMTNAIKATMLAPTKADMDAYEEALANYVAPTYTSIDLADAAARVTYYRGFLDNNTKATEKQFLAKEIEAANAQGYVEGNFSTTSWATYTEALAKATEVNTDPSASQSAVFDAKYALMVARNGLMDKADSCIDNGAYMQLEALIAQADVMFQNTTLYTVKEGDAADAWANLVAALGYEYEDENGDIQNLYVNSAKAYVASDRVMSSTTDAELASQVATLQDAINQFTCAIQVVPDEDVPDNSTNVEQTELIIDGLVPATIASSEDLLALVKAAAPEGYNVTLESVASAAGYYGTGATVKANVAELGGQTVATYTVVIYGDVNGDGAVDAFDAAVLDLDLADVQALTGAYGLAADTNADAQVAVADYTLVKDAIAGTATINQVR